jgi:hypothetical protein
MIKAKPTVTARVTEQPKRNAKSNAERQKAWRKRRKLKGKTDAEWLAETVGADG